MGQARTLNRGYRLARGALLGYLSDDDLLAPGAVDSLVREFDQPDVVAAYPAYRIIDAEGAVIDTVRPIEYSPVEAFRLIETVIGPGCLVRREVLEANGAWDAELHFMSDFILWIKVGLAGRAVRVAEPLASWRRHPASISLQVVAEHGSELLSLVQRGARLLDLPLAPWVSAPRPSKRLHTGGILRRGGRRLAGRALRHDRPDSARSSAVASGPGPRRCRTSAPIGRRLSGASLRG